MFNTQVPASFVQEGNSIDYTPTADVAAGKLVVQNDLIGIAKLDIAAGELGALAVTGVFAIPKATGEGTAIAAGVKLYWDATNNVATTTDNSGANKYLGKSIRAAGTAESTVRVRLSP
jgi:predicted RecA/RadA family phage recombinase